MMITFSGDLILQIQSVRHQNQIEKLEKSETLEFSLKEWNNFSDNQEIKFQNSYYDVISSQTINSKVVAKVVKDDFENEIRVSIHKIFSKTKSSSSNQKKSNTFSKHVICKNEFVYKNKFDFIKLTNFSEVLISKTSNFIEFSEKPPCTINFYAILDKN